MSRHHSSSSESRPGFLHLTSSASHHSISKEDSVFDLAHFSTEDLPIAAAPSPHPGRRGFPGGDDGVVSDEEGEREEMVQYEVCHSSGRGGYCIF